MKLQELPFEIISEIVEYIPAKNILNFLLISKDFYQFIEFDEFWKCLLKNYFKSEIKYCKENLNELILNKDALQDYLNIYSIENFDKINKNKIYYNNLKKLNKNKLLSVTINMKLLQQFVELYKNNIIYNNSINKPSFKRFLPTNLQQNMVDNINNKNTIVMNQTENTKFRNRFEYLLQQSIKCKCSILINCLANDLPAEFQYLFIELFFTQNTTIDKKLKENDNLVYNNNEVYNKRKNQEFILKLLKDIKIKFNLQNYIYEKFVSKFILFIDPIVYSLLTNYSHDTNFRDETLQNILKLLQKYNLTISFNNFLKCCEVNLFNISKEFFDYLFITMEDKFYKDYNNNYFIVCNLVKIVMGDDDTVIDENYCKKLNYLMNLIITEKCDYKKLICDLEGFIYKKLNNLLTCEEDTSKEVYNLFKSLQFFKYKDIKLPITHNFFNLQFNLKNFKYLINLNIISKEDLLTLFHKYFILNNSFRFILNKRFTKKQIELYLDYFINELYFDIYSKDKFGNNILINTFHNCNIYTIINPIN
ncbi:hypothetical protein ABK040_000776 [Willaertia magna]